MEKNNNIYKHEVEIALKYLFKDDTFNFWVVRNRMNYNDNIDISNPKYSMLKSIYNYINNEYDETTGFVGEYPTGIYESTISENPDCLFGWLDGCENNFILLDKEYSNTSFERTVELELKKAISESCLPDTLKLFVEVSDHSIFDLIKYLVKGNSKRAFVGMYGNDYDLGVYGVFELDDCVITLSFYIDDNDYGSSAATLGHVDINVIK